MYRDVVDVIEQGGERLDLIMIPKVGTAADVYAVDMLVTQVEDAMGRKKRIGFEMIIETALGMANVDAIAAASPRNESLHFGVADYAASTKARTTVIGGPNALYGVLTDPDGDNAARLSLGRHVALRHRPHGGGGPGQRPAAHRRALRRLFRSRGFQGPGEPRRGAGLRGQVGHPPEPDRPGQRGQQPLQGKRSRRPSGSFRPCARHRKRARAPFLWTAV